MHEITGLRTIEVFCPTHKIGITATGGERIVCRAGPHALAERFPDGEFWKYCCDCQRFWPSEITNGALSEPKCPVCGRDIARRFLCSDCNVVSVESDDPGRRKTVSLNSEGIATPACPGCFGYPKAKALDHDCEDFGASFTTTRSVCPFCKDALEPPPGFPCSVAVYLEKLRPGAVRLKFDPERNKLQESPSGDYVLVEKVRGSALPIVVPRAAKLASKQDYYNTYYELFNCDNPAAGEVIILSPAIVEKSENGWQLREAGFINIKPDWTAPVTTPLTQEMTRCGTCGAAGSLDHAFCNACGSPLGQIPVNESTQDNESETQELNSESSADVYGAATSRFYEDPRADDTVVSTPVKQPASGAKAIAGVLGGLALLGIAIAIIASLSGGGKSVEKKLDTAIAKGNLFTPTTENAHDLYSELKNSSANEETLKRYREKLTPLLTSHGYQLTTNLMQIGYEEPNSSEWDEATKKLDWAVELNPGNNYVAARAAYARGRSGYLQKQLDVALNSWTRAADLDKSWVLPVNGLGMIYTAKRDWGTARSYFFQALKRDANWPFPNENIGNTYREERNYSTAKEFYQKALAKQPNWAKPHIHLGNIAMVENEYATAVSEYESALAPNAIGLKGNEPAFTQKALDKARQKLSASSDY